MIATMNDHLRAGVGLILGVAVGLVIVTLLSGLVVQDGHVLGSSLEIGIVVFVALVGFAAGVSMGTGNRRH
jgi:uncharacterized membrane protein